MNEPQQPHVTDSGIWKRGMILFVVMAAITGIALFFALRRTGQSTLRNPVRPELLTAFVTAPQAGFPATLSWGVFYQYQDNLPSPKGWEIRYNATIALARRGSDKVRLDVLAEMMDERRQMVNYRKRRKDGKFTARESAAWLTALNAMKAFQQWREHERKPIDSIEKGDPDLQRVYAALQKLTGSRNKLVRDQALAVQKEIGKKTGG